MFVIAFQLFFKGCLNLFLCFFQKSFGPWPTPVSWAGWMAGCMAAWLIAVAEMGSGYDWIAFSLAGVCHLLCSFDVGFEEKGLPT